MTRTYRDHHSKLIQRKMEPLWNRQVFAESFDLRDTNCTINFFTRYYKSTFKVLSQLVCSILIKQRIRLMTWATAVRLYNSVKDCRSEYLFHTCSVTNSLEKSQSHSKKNSLLQHCAMKAECRVNPYSLCSTIEFYYSIFC